MSATVSTAVPVSALVHAPTQTSFLTPDRVLTMNNMSAALAAVSLVLCLAVLGLVVVLYLNTEARKMLDRLSFRLLVYALISNCFYSVGYIICVKVNPGFWCVAGVWLIQFWLGVTNYFLLCIALNLQLVLVHSFNGLALEKYYILGTFLLNLAITLPPLIRGKFGWDPVLKVCWLTSSTRDDRLLWQICTQIFWILLAVVVTLVSALTTMVYLYKHKFPAKERLSASNSSEDRDRHRDEAAHSQPCRLLDIPMLDAHGKPISDRKIRRTASRLASSRLSSCRKFRNIIFRISLYPLIMILLNFFITAADLRISTTSGIYSQRDYYLYIVYYAFYGGRGIFYALIAIIDPSIIRGVSVWRGQADGAREDEFTLGEGIIGVQGEIIRFVEEIGLYEAGGKRRRVRRFTERRLEEGSAERRLEEGGARGEGGAVVDVDVVAEAEAQAGQMVVRQQLHAVREVRRQI